MNLSNRLFDDHFLPLNLVFVLVPRLFDFVVFQVALILVLSFRPLVIRHSFPEERSSAWLTWCSLIIIGSSIRQALLFRPIFNRSDGIGQIHHQHPTNAVCRFQAARHVSAIEVLTRHFGSTASGKDIQPRSISQAILQDSANAICHIAIRAVAVDNGEKSFLGSKVVHLGDESRITDRSDGGKLVRHVPHDFVAGRHIQGKIVPVGLLLSNRSEGEWR